MTKIICITSHDIVDRKVPQNISKIKLFPIKNISVHHSEFHGVFHQLFPMNEMLFCFSLRSFKSDITHIFKLFIRTFYKKLNNKGFIYLLDEINRFVLFIIYLLRDLRKLETTCLMLGCCRFQIVARRTKVLEKNSLCQKLQYFD